PPWQGRAAFFSPPWEGGAGGGLKRQFASCPFQTLPTPPSQGGEKTRQLFGLLSFSEEADPTLQQIIRYLGAGLYEETLFRLVLFSGLLGLFLAMGFPRGGAFLLACVLSALVFAAAHHLGPHGEPFHFLVFLFRSLAG